jgi:hypothetical protein
VGDFYQYRGKIDGKCKSCRCLMARQNRTKRIDYYRAYDAMRAMNPDRVAARRAYIVTEAGKQSHQKALKRLIDIDREKYRAHYATTNAVRDGRLRRQPCEVCGAEKSQAHHDDYSKPLEVRWLCSRHHRELHKCGIL